MITLTFEEYQEIRDAMAMARGNLHCYEGGDVPYFKAEPGLKVAGDTLERARWRTEAEQQANAGS